MSALEPRTKIPIGTVPLIQVANELDRLRMWANDHDDHVEMVRLWQTLESLTKQLEDVITNCEADLIRMHDDSVWVDGAEVDGLALEAKRAAPKKQWESPALLGAVIRQSLDPAGTGEIPASLGEVIAAIREGLQTALSMNPSTPWKATGLKALHIWQDDFCQTEPGRRRIGIKEVPK